MMVSMEYYQIPEKLYDLIQSLVRDGAGCSDIEIINMIVFSWLSEHGYLDKELWNVDK